LQPGNEDSTATDLHQGTGPAASRKAAPKAHIRLREQTDTRGAIEMHRSKNDVAHVLGAAMAALLVSAANPAWAADAAAAQDLAKKSDCFKCHATDKKKDGPSFKETAAKYKGKANGEADVTKHVTTSPKVKVDGVEEEHKPVKSKNEAEVRNLVQWILAQ
jgi:cytochrome c